MSVTTVVRDTYHSSMGANMDLAFPGGDCT